MTDQPLFLDKRTSLFCIVSAPNPEAPERDFGIVILNSGTIHNVGPFGLSVDFAKSLSERGYPVLRLDQTGKGESSDMSREQDDHLTLERDISLACSALEHRFGVTRIAIIGLCSGADQGLEIASKLDQTAALVMLDGWAPRNFRYFVARYAPKLKQPLTLPRLVLRRLVPKRRSNSLDDNTLRDIGETRGLRWDNDEMSSYMQALCSKKVPLLAIYTGDADNYYSYSGQLASQLSRQSIDVSRLTESFWQDRKHLYPIVSHREKLVNDVTEWICDIS